MEENNTPSESITPSTPVPAERSSRWQKLKHFIFGSKKRKVVSGIIAGLIFVALLFTIPITRYGMLSPFVKKDITIYVVDKTTNKPVSLAVVSVGDMSAKTATNGQAVLKSVPVGEYDVKIEKKHFTKHSESITVPILSTPSKKTIPIIATGRQVAVAIINTITKEPVADAKLIVKDSEVTTDQKGEATIVLPVGKDELEGKITTNEYNTTTVKVAVTEDASKNHFILTPAGRVYYLSKQTGKINVMGANLDGTNSEVVVAATGNESDTDTVLLAARDWKYLALQAKRTNSKDAQLYLVDTAAKQLKLIDEGNASFTLVGWSGHTFVYQVYRNDKHSWEPKSEAMKSYNAETGKLTTIDETQAAGSNSYDYQQENIVSPYILDNKLVYAKGWWFGQQWAWSSNTLDKKMTINSVSPDGANKQVAKSFTMTASGSIQGRLYEPQGIYFRVSNDGSKAEYVEYEDSVVESVSVRDDTFYNTNYPTYLISPSGKQTFWFEPRDGHNTLFVGNQDGKNGKELARQSDYLSYGWYGDDYILLSKNSSELYIASANNTFSDTNTPFKITNYHKPSISYPGYGYGYGGI